MIEISNTVSWEVRKKRAYSMLTLSETAKEIGISRQTLRKIENGQLSRTTKPVFSKVIDWLLIEKGD